MKLIINADDYGLTKAVSKGIIKGMKDGIITDTTAMTNMPYFEESIKLAKDNGIKEMGIHLVLSAGKPLLSTKEIKSLVDEKGNFYRTPELVEEKADIKDVEKELRAQIKKFLDTGMKLNHIDSHHHSCGFRDDIYKLVLKFASELGVPVRCPFEENRSLIVNGTKYPEGFSVEFYEEMATIENLTNIIDKNKWENSFEIMCHPGFCDDELKKVTSYSDYREKELEILLSNEIKNYISNNGIELINFSKL